MRIEEEVRGDVTILHVHGKMTLGEGDEILEQKIRSLVEENRTKVVLDLEPMPYIDSAGLCEVVRSYTKLSRLGGNIKLVGARERVLDLLKITKLLDVFQRYDTEHEAVRSFETVV